MTTRADIPQNTRRLATLSPNASMFAWVLGALPSCLFLFFPPGLLFTVPFFVVLSAVGAFSGYRARQQLAEGPNDLRLSRYASGGFYIGLAGTVVGLLMGIGLLVGVLALGPAAFNEMFR